MTFTIGVGIIKMGFALTLLRLLRERLHLIILYLTMAFVVVGTLFVVFFVTFFCAPVAYAWTRVLDPYLLLTLEGVDAGALGYKPRGKCMNTSSLVAEGYSQVVLLIVSDVALGIVLPALLLKNLKMRRSLKVTSGVILACGSLASVASVARIPYIPAIASSDVFFSCQPLFVWCTIEYAWCLIATSCATLKPLVVALRIFRDDHSRAAPYERRTPALPQSDEKKTAGSSGYYTTSTTDRSWAETTLQGDGLQTVNERDSAVPGLRTWLDLESGVDSPPHSRGRDAVMSGIYKTVELSIGHESAGSEHQHF